MAKVKVSDLQLGDIVRLFDGPYGYATVRRINNDGSAQVYRPHVICADFAYTGGVPVSVGIEDFSIIGEVERVKKGDKLR